jgi:hypothetical protein
MDVAFVTEKVICSLSNILFQFRNFPNEAELYEEYHETYGSLTEPEITRGFLNLASSLEILHTVSKRLHLNITPENILLLPNGQWKLCGFGLSLSFQPGETIVPIPYFLPTRSLSSSPSSQLSPVLRFEPNEAYSCPEIVTSSEASSIQTVTTEADIFSLGVVMFELYNYHLFSMNRGLSHRPLFSSSSFSSSSSPSPPPSPPTKLSILSAVHQKIDSLPLSSAALRSLLLALMDPNPSTRPKASTVTSHTLFVSSPLSLYYQLDRLPRLAATLSHQRHHSSPSSSLLTTSTQLFTTLPSAVSQLRVSVLYNQLLPPLARETQLHPSLWEYSLPILIAISHLLPLPLFLEHISSLFITAFSSTNSELMLLLLHHMNFFLDLFPPSFFNQHIVRLFYNAINSSALPALQATAISILTDEKILLSVERVYYRQTLIPLVCQVVCQKQQQQQEGEQSVRLHGVIFLKFILSTLEEKDLVTYFLPTLKHLLTSPTPPSSSISVSGLSTSPLDPVLLVTVLSLYRQISPLVTIDIVCREILVVLMPLLLERSLPHDLYRHLLDQINFYQAQVLQARERDYNPPVESFPLSTPPPPPLVIVEPPTPIPSSSSYVRQPYRDQITPSPTPMTPSFDQPSHSSSSVTDNVAGVQGAVEAGLGQQLNSLTLREEIQRTQSEIVKLQSHLSMSPPPAPAPLSSMIPPLSYPPQSAQQNDPLSSVPFHVPPWAPPGYFWTAQQQQGQLFNSPYVHNNGYPPHLQPSLPTSSFPSSYGVQKDKPSASPSSQSMNPFDSSPLSSPR